LLSKGNEETHLLKTNGWLDFKDIPKHVGLHKPTMYAHWNLLEADALSQREQQLEDVSYCGFSLPEIISTPYMNFYFILFLNFNFNFF